MRRNLEDPTSATVLIVGAGPVGMTMASELVRYGVSVRIIDHAARRTDKSKALVLWSRTLELLERGIDGAAPFTDIGLKCHCVSIMNGSELIGRVELDTVRSPYPYALMIPQSETERLLEERLGKQGVIVERNVEATTIEVRDDCVQAVLRHADGREEAAQADWLVGCDGAHSTVRHSVGAAFDGETLPSDWLLADVHLSNYPNGTDLTVFWHRDGVLVIFPIEADRYRVVADIPLLDGGVVPTPTLDEVQALLDRRAPHGMRVSNPVWLSGFRINDRKVADYRFGRVFLAGDAAHIHSPAGGQGMNTGMQDAFNLAWKLALVSQGACGVDLLDSYTAERSHVGDQVLAATGRLTKMATLRNPLAQHVRNFVMHAVLGFSQVRHAAANTVTETAVHYPHSPINGPSMGDGPGPGERFVSDAVQAPIGSWANPRFILFAAETGELNTMLHGFSNLVDHHIRAPIRAGLLLLVRPDGYVACSTDNVSAIADYLLRIGGRA